MKGSLIVVNLLLLFVLSVKSLAPLNLGAAETFAVLGGSGLTNTGPTTITGDIGSYPTPTMIGFGTVTQIGINHLGDSTTQQAKLDLVTAYNTAAGLTPPIPIVADLSGQTLFPGIYHAVAITLTGPIAVFLDGGGDSNAVFVFQSDTTVTTSSVSLVTLTNGTQAGNIFWACGSSATLGSASNFSGTVIALTSITANSGAVINGRVLAGDGAVTLDTNTVKIVQLATPSPTETPTDTISGTNTISVSGPNVTSSVTKSGTLSSSLFPANSSRIVVSSSGVVASSGVISSSVFISASSVSASNSVVISSSSSASISIGASPSGTPSGAALTVSSTSSISVGASPSGSLTGGALTVSSTSSISVGASPSQSPPKPTSTETITPIYPPKSETSVYGVCGNGVIERSEECDPGPVVPRTKCCSPFCTILPVGSTCGKAVSKCTRRAKCVRTLASRQLICQPGKQRKVGVRCGGIFSKRTCKADGSCKK